MRVVLQRVSSASVTIGGRVTGQIARGLLVFVGIENADSSADGAWLAGKIVKLRIFADEEGKMNLSLLDLAANESGLPRPSQGDGTSRAAALAKADVLVISQFTLQASTRKGTRPSFNQAARPGHARPLYNQFVTQLSVALGRPSTVPVLHSPGEGGSPAERVQTGEFGAHMDVALVNDGPVTLILDSKLRE